MMAIWDMSDRDDQCKESDENAVTEQTELSANADSFTEYFRLEKRQHGGQRQIKSLLQVCIESEQRFVSLMDSLLVDLLAPHVTHLSEKSCLIS